MVPAAGSKTSAMDLRTAFQRGVQDYRSGRLAAAEAAFRQILKRQPNQPDALHMLGVLAHRHGDQQKAVKLIKRAIRGNPGNASFYVNLGEAFRAGGRLERAVAAYRQALDIRPDSVEAHCNLGSALQAQGRHQAALESFQRALSENPDFTQAHFNLGNLLFEQGELEAARAAFRRAAELSPTFADARFNLGNALGRLGDLKGAVEAYRHCLELVPRFAPAHFNLGNALRDQADFDAAAASYARALELDPALAAAEVNLGGLLKRRLYLKDALAHCRRALELQPELAEAHANIGHVHLLADDAEGALTAYRKAVEAEPGFAAGHMGLAAALGKLGRLEEARQSSKRGLELKRTAVRPARGVEAGRVVVLKGIEDGCFEIAATDNLNVFVGLNNADSHFDTETIWQCDLFVDGLEPERAIEALPDCDVIFNVISDVDAMPRCHAIAKAIAERAPVPLLNPPAAVEETQRDRNYQVLAGREGIVFPKTLRIGAAERRGLDLPARLAAEGIGYPLLLRCAGTHTGESLERVEDHRALADYLAAHDEGALYVSAFIDFSGPQGGFTKMRAFFVDGELYPVHLFVSEDWYVRGHEEARRLMLENSWMVEAKQAFLADPLGYLGEAAHRALLSIKDAIGLDYFGVDFAKLDDGRILVFEANAVMNHHYHFIDDFPFQKAYLDAVTEALNELLLTRIEASKRAR